MAPTKEPLPSPIAVVDSLGDFKLKEPSFRPVTIFTCFWQWFCRDNLTGFGRGRWEGTPRTAFILPAYAVITISGEGRNRTYKV